jgi:hypothetical protein
MRFVGRGDTRELFKALLARPLEGRRRVSVRRPVLVLEDPRGGGKTELLRSFERLLVGSRVPFVLLDAEDVEPGLGTTAANHADRVPLANLIYAIAFQLNRDWGKPYGRIKFHRLTLARLVISMHLEADPYDREAAGQEIDKLAQSRRPGVERTRKLLADGAENATHGVLGSLQLPEALRQPVADVARSIPDRFLALLRRWVVGRWLVLGRYYSWFEGRGQHGSVRAADVLLDLRELTRPGKYEDNESWIDKTLLRALLADLSDHFARRRRLAIGCALLVDNADGLVGQRLVRLLVEVRREETQPPDPLAVVVTSRGGLRPVYANEIRDLGEDTRRPGQEQVASAWRSELTGRAVPLIGWRKLSDLTQEDTSLLIEPLGIRGENPSLRQVQELVQGVTDGQPACTVKLVEMLDLHREKRGRPQQLLDEKILIKDAQGDRRGPPLAEWMVTYLTGQQVAPVRSSGLETLITCAAASTWSDARELGPLIDSGQLNLVARTLWPSSPSAISSLTRRLLLRLLAARDPKAPDSWSAVMKRLIEIAKEAEEHEKGGDQAATLRRLGYQLASASGEENGAKTGAEYLVGHLAASPPEQWLSWLHEIGSAPHPFSSSEPKHEYQERRSELLRRMGLNNVASATPEQQLIATVGTWLLGYWITNDPLTDHPRGDVWLDMAKRVEPVLQASLHDDIWPFHREIENYVMKAGHWS